MRIENGKHLQCYQRGEASKDSFWQGLKPVVVQAPASGQAMLARVTVIISMVDKGYNCRDAH
jgi:hypothetical protein